MTAPVFINPILPVQLTTPVNLVSHYCDGMVLVSWDETSLLDLNVIGYRLMLKLVRTDGTDSTAFQPLVQIDDVLILNYYEDLNVQEGVTYAYQVTAIGTNNIQSEGRIPSMVTVPVFRPVSVATLNLLKTGEGITVSWEPTIQNEIVTYKVYRMQDGIPPVLLVTLTPEKTICSDTTATRDVVYVYAITCTNSKGIESRIDEWTGL